MKLLALAAAALILGSGTVASAATIFATTVEADRGTVLRAPRVNDSLRSDPSAALGGVDGRFYSMGLGGSVTLGFGQIFAGGLITAYELTYNPVGHAESVDVFALLGGEITALIGSIDNALAQSGMSLRYAGTFDGLYLVDTTPRSSPSFDGFDLDAISVSPVPLPAAGLLLLAGLGGLGALRRRKGKPA